VSKLEPLVAAPHSPDNRKTARECSDVKIDRVYIGSCTGGKTEDFVSAAKLFYRAGRQVKVPTYLVPATQKVRGGCVVAACFA
jgi:3-isopropylmalate/(R)-2-methylmalate dehydratase large subunit